MPSCCLLLCRAFVRVDGVRVALHDTRWYIDFDEAAGQQVAPPPSPPHTATAAPPLDLPPPARGWEAVRPAATEDSGAATAAAGGAAPAAGATALLLCDEQQRGGAMGAVREALGLPPLQYSSPMLRADAALAAAGVHPAVAESMRARSQGGLGPAAATQEAALAGAGTVGAEEAAVAGGYDDGLPPHGGGGFSWAIDADEVAVLKPSDAGTWALRLRVRPAAAPGAAT